MNEVKQILAAVQASLEPYRKAHVDARDRQAHVEVLKQQSTANVFKAQVDAAETHKRLDDHTALIQARKLERVKARVESFASGGKVEPQAIDFDTLGRQLAIDAEEADAVLVQLQEVYARRCDELQKAEADVATAAEAVSQAYLEGVAARMLEHDSIIRELHAELSEMVPSEIDSKPGAFQRLPLSIQKALRLVPINVMDTPVNKLRGYELIPGKWTPTSGPRVNTVFQDEHPLRVLGPLPRNADGIPQKI